MSGRTVSIEVETESGTAQKHVNVDNITFLEASYVELTDFAKKLQWGTTAAVALLFLVMFDIFWAIGTGVVSFAIIGGLLWRPNTLQIGTVTATYELNQDVAALEQDFAEAAREVLTIAGEETGRYRTHRYRYHVVPENAVSVAHEHTEDFPLNFLVGGVGVLSLAGTIFLDFPSEGVLVGLGLIALGVYLDPLPQPDTLTIEFGTGETEDFELSTTDANAFVEEFQNRTGSHVLVGSGTDHGSPANVASQAGNSDGSAGDDAETGPNPVPGGGGNAGGGDKLNPAAVGVEESLDVAALADEFDADGDAIRDALIDPSSADMSEFSDELREFVTSTHDEFTRNMFSDFADQLRSSDPETRADAVQMVNMTQVDLDNFGLVVPPLLTVVARAENESVRETAVETLHRIARRAPRHFEGTMNRLVDLLDHDDVFVRTTAADLLAAVAGTHAEELAARRSDLAAAANAHDEDVASSVRAAAARADVEL